MDENKKKKIIRLAISVAIMLIAAIVIFVWRLNNPPADMDAMPVLQALSDGFFIVGFLCAGFGLLLWISSTGLLDIIGYGFKSLLYLFTPYKKDREEGGFYEYKLEKKEKRKPVPFEYIWIGSAMLVLALIFALFV